MILSHLRSRKSFLKSKVLICCPLKYLYALSNVLIFTKIDFVVINSSLPKAHPSWWDGQKSKILALRDFKNDFLDRRWLRIKFKMILNVYEKFFFHHFLDQNCFRSSQEPKMARKLIFLIFFKVFLSNIGMYPLYFWVSKTSKEHI